MPSWVSFFCADKGLLPGMHLGSLVKLQGGGVVLKFCTVMQAFCAVCMQAMTHSVDNAPSRQAVKLVVVGPCFVEQCCFGLFLGDQLQ